MLNRKYGVKKWRILAGNFKEKTREVSGEKTRFIYVAFIVFATEPGRALRKAHIKSLYVSNIHSSESYVYRTVHHLDS